MRTTPVAPTRSTSTLTASSGACGAAEPLGDVAAEGLDAKGLEAERLDVERLGGEGLGGRLDMRFLVIPDRATRGALRYDSAARRLNHALAARYTPANSSRSCYADWLQTAKARSALYAARAGAPTLLLALLAVGCARGVPALGPPPPNLGRASEARAWHAEGSPGSDQLPPAAAAPPKVAQGAGAMLAVEAASPVAELPATLEVGRFHSLQVDQGQIEVLHAPAAIRRALIYLHGACGDIHAAKAFTDVLQRYATLIALRGERSCGRADRYYWSGRVEPLMQRIDQALDAVASLRAGLLDTREVVLFGYSQGSQVAQLLTERWPERFPEVILGGVPSTPSVSALRHARSVALIGGSRELLTPMRRGAWLLEHNQIRTQLFVLKGARHGSFGSTPSQDLARVFSWLFG